MSKTLDEALIVKRQKNYPLTSQQFANIQLNYVCSYPSLPRKSSTESDNEFLMVPLILYHATDNVIRNKYLPNDPNVSQRAGNNRRRPLEKTSTQNGAHLSQNKYLSFVFVKRKARIVAY